MLIYFATITWFINVSSRGSLDKSLRLVLKTQHAVQDDGVQSNVDVTKRQREHDHYLPCKFEYEQRQRREQRDGGIALDDILFVFFAWPQFCRVYSTCLTSEAWCNSCAMLPGSVQS